MKKELDTVEKANEFIKEFKVLGFNYVCDNVATYKSLIPINKDGYLIEYEFLFFIEECDTFFSMDSIEEFLGDLKLFEIIEKCEELDSRKTLFHRKYDSDVIETNYDLSQTEDYDETKIIYFEEDLEVKLKRLIEEQNFEEASKVRDKIQKLKK